MKNEYDKMFNNPVSPAASASPSSVNETIEPEQSTSTGTDLYSTLYRGDWKASQPVNFRSEPSMKGTILAVIKEGEKISCSGHYALEENNKDVVWLKATFNGKTGYTMKAFYSRR